MPRVLAVLRLSRTVKWVDCSTGKSEGFASRAIRSASSAARPAAAARSAPYDISPPALTNDRAESKHHAVAQGDGGEPFGVADKNHGIRHKQSAAELHGHLLGIDIAGVELRDPPYDYERGLQILTLVHRRLVQGPPVGRNGNNSGRRRSLLWWPPGRNGRRGTAWTGDTSFPEAASGWPARW